MSREKDFLTADEVKERLEKYEKEKEVLCSQTKLMNAIYKTPKEMQSWSRAWWLVNHAPVVDAVEVVRCGECTNRLVNSRGENKCWQDHDNGVNSLPLDWFCADGERMGEEDETNRR